MFALAFAHFYQICERGTQSAFDCRPCIFGNQSFFREPHHAGRLEDGGDVDLAGGVQFLLQRAHRFMIRTGEFSIERQVPRAVRAAVKTHRRICATAGNIFVDCLANARFQLNQIARQIDHDVALLPVHGV
jgi:hypothetical protein